MWHSRVGLHLWWSIILVFLVVNQCSGLNRDGALLLSFKHSVVSDPVGVLRSWNYSNETPCSWNGVTCSNISSAEQNAQARVIGLSLPNSKLVGSIPYDLGLIDHLRILDLSGNSLNGSLPSSLFQAFELESLNLSGNLIGGEVPDSIVQLRNLQVVNLSDNALAGKIPTNLANMQNLTVASLNNNYLSGYLPGGFQTLQVLDLSSNLFNGSLPPDFGGASLRYLNISYNNILGKIPPEFAEKIPGNASIDLSFNNLTGQIPDSLVLINQQSKSFSGNPDLCGEPTKNPCPVPPPNIPVATSPALAAFPNTFDSPPEFAASPSISSHSKRNGIRRTTVIGIVVGDIVGIIIIALIFVYVYQLKRRKNVESALKIEATAVRSDWSPPSSPESRGFRTWSCLRKKEKESTDDDTISSSGSEVEAQNGQNQKVHDNQRQHEQEAGQGKTGTLITVDGEKELEVETLLKASAFILGATGSSIMYKAVLEDGSALAVRRIGENGLERFKNLETQVRVIAKLVHPNLVRVRGFYWGIDEKLIIYDFVPNGSLANFRYRKVGSSPCHLPWEVRLKIARGVAHGLAYLHDKKHVHGNLKPSNILLGNDMEPKIGDFGLERIVTGDSSCKAGASARIFGSKRSTASRDSFPDVAVGPSPSPSPSTIGGVSPYHAPESLRNLKPNPKWDVYSFGVLFLELLTGKIVVLDDMGQPPGFLVEDKARALRMADMAIRADMEGKEESLLAWFKLGYSCVSSVPQKRPSMKEVLQVIEKTPSSRYYAH
ncbi:hypothetical protein K1719_029408 [Acacia pycnantha]|nr:hypothetical protein K1719_029408 [Acacia pycnantha]